MPRLSPTLLQKAARINRDLPCLLRECRDLESARLELRWLKEGVEQKPGNQVVKRAILQSWVQRRARGEPLQYILGTQPFGELEINVEPGVLIPRPETETYVEQLGHQLSRRNWSDKTTIRIADFCTGTGCIALGLASQLQPVSSKYGINLQLRGFDISSKALALADHNLQHNMAIGQLSTEKHLDIAFAHLDVLGLAQRHTSEIKGQMSSSFGGNQPDVIISNPPYISPEDYRPGGQTSRSVRLYEPKIALVPPEDIVFPEVCRADQFYAALLRIMVAVQPSLLLMEVGDSTQALRVWHMCQRTILTLKLTKASVEIWKDDTSVLHEEDQITINSRTDGNSEARAVVLWLDGSKTR